MYIDYSRLWALLASKNMTKSDLSRLTGISSKVMAKLAKCDTVTTETIARICETLECDVEDIMECRAEKSMTTYERYRKFGKTVDENELYKTIKFSDEKGEVTVYLTKKAANKATRIHCRANGCVYWEQLYIMGGMSRAASEEQVLIRPKRQNGGRTVLVIRGKPAIITGLDEGIFISCKNSERTDEDIFVMSQTAFKQFCFSQK